MLFQKFGAPVVMDITHSLQQPNQSSGVTGGKPALIETIAKAAIPFFMCLVVCIVLITVFPQIVTYLPDLVMGTEK